MTKRGVQVAVQGRLVRCAALLAVALWAAAAAGQAAKPPAPPPAEPPPPEVIPIGAVTSRANALEQRLANIETDLASAKVEAQAQQDLEEVVAVIEEARAGLDAAFERTMLPSELQALSTRWNGYEKRLAEVEEALAKRVSRLDEQTRALEASGELWERTAAAARQSAAPPEVHTRIAATQKKLRSAGAAITRQRNAALALQSSSAQRLGSIDPVKERIRKASEAMAVGLLVRQDEPLWRAWPGRDQFAQRRQAVVDALAGLATEINDYAQRKGGAIVAHALVILGLAWLLLRTRRFVDARHAALGVDPGGALRYPISAAILAGFLLRPVLQPEIARGLMLLLAVGTLPFWYRVLAGMLPPALDGPLRAAALLTLVEVLRLGVFGADFVGRLVLLAELVAGAAGVWWLRRPARLALIPDRLRDGGWMHLLGGWLLLVLVFFSVGAVCALLGYTSIAARLCILAVTGSFYGASLMALVRVLEMVSEHFFSASFFDAFHMIGHRRAAVAAGLSKVLRVGGFGLWVYMELGRAQLWEPLSGAVGAVLSRPLGFGTGHLTLAAILAFVLTLWLSWLVARFVSAALDEEVFPRLHMSQGLPFALSRFARYGVLVLGFIIAMGTLGFSLDRVTLLLSAVGVGIGFGLQNVINNFVSGLILLFERPVRVGDRVQLADLLGVVTHIGIRASRIRTFDGSDVVVPNGDLIASQLINWTLSDAKRRIILAVGAAYGTDPERVLQILEQVARDNPEVLEDPAPECLFLGFGDSSLDFELRAWTESLRGWFPVRSDLAVAVNRAFAEAAVQIPFPQRDLHLRNLDELRDVLKPGEHDTS